MAAGISPRRLKMVAAAALLLSLLLLGVPLWIHRTSAPAAGEEPAFQAAAAKAGTREKRPRPEGGVTSRERGKSGQEDLARVDEMVPADAPEVVEALEKIKQLERQRVEFDTEWVQEKQTIHEYYLRAPSPAEGQEIKRIIATLHGSVDDPLRGVRTWQEKLREEYVMPPEFEGCVVTTVFVGDPLSGSYELNGIPIGKFARRTNGSVVSMDRTLYSYFHSSSFELGSAWRFSYLYEGSGLDRR